MAGANGNEITDALNGDGLKIRPLLPRDNDRGQILNLSPTAWENKSVPSNCATEAMTGI